MKKRRIKSSPGSASYSAKNPICNRNQSSPSTSNRSDISKYFNKKMENTAFEVVESPYKNLVTEPVLTLNNSVEEENDFKTPKCYKQSKFKEISNKSGCKSKKTRPKKSNIIRRQRKLTSMLEDNFAYNNVNHEHLHLALALSKSEQPNEEPDDDIEITCSYSTAQHTLEQFGFKSNKMVIRNGKPPKKSKKSKYQFITPILYIRTEEDRQNLISSKISAILSHNIQPEYNYDREGIKIKSSYLQNFIDEDSRIFRLSNIDYDKLNNDMFYSESLNLERSSVKCGHFLKDWGKIAGRDRTPPRRIANSKCEVKLEIKNVSKSLSPDLFSSDDDDDNEEIKQSIDKSLQSSFNMIDDIKNIESLKNSEFIFEENKDKFANQTPTVRESDDDVIEVNDSTDEIEFEKESLQEPNENTIKINNDKMSDSRNNLDDVSEENRMDTTDNILASLEITSIESVGLSGAQKNLDILSASLLSNFNSLNKTNGSEIDQKDNSDDSDSNITFQNLNGIEHFENFYDADNELNFNITTDSKPIKENDLGKFNFNHQDNSNKQLSTREKIYDLTQSDEDSDQDVNKRYNGRELSHRFQIKSADPFNCLDNVQPSSNNRNRINTKYEILSDSDDNVNDCSKRNGTVRKSLSFTVVSNQKTPSDFKKYSSFDTTSPLKLNLNDFCELGEDESEFDNPEIKGLFEKSIIINTEEKRNISFKKSLSFTPISNIEKNREKFMKHASFSTPTSSKLNPGGGSDDKINSISSENLDYINDEELNYSSIRSTPYQRKVLPQTITEEDNLNTYSYLEKYYDEQFYNDGNNYEQSPIPHRCISELTRKDKTPTSLCKIDNVSTPDGYVVVKTRNITPMPDYDNMNTPKLTKELEKVGVKQLKRHRSIQMLKHIYETTHPLCLNINDEDGNENVKRQKVMNELEVTGGSSKELVEIIGDIPEKDDLIFERTQSKKIHSCRLPLHIAWHNLLSANPELKQNILLYEPLQLEVLYAMLKDQGYKYHLQDLLTFLDKKCITIRTNQNNRQSRKRF